MAGIRHDVKVVRDALLEQGCDETVAERYAKVAVETINKRDISMGRVTAEATRNFIASAIERESVIADPVGKKWLEFAVKIARTTGMYKNEGDTSGYTTTVQ